MTPSHKIIVTKAKKVGFVSFSLKNLHYKKVVESSLNGSASLQTQLHNEIGTSWGLCSYCRCCRCFSGSRKSVTVFSLRRMT